MPSCQEHDDVTKEDRKYNQTNVEIQVYMLNPVTKRMMG